MLHFVALAMLAFPSAVAEDAPSSPPPSPSSPTTTTPSTTEPSPSSPSTAAPSTTAPTNAAATPATAVAARRRVLLLDLEAQGTEPENARVITGILASLIGECEGAELLTTADMRKMMDLAASKQSAGCGADSCLSDLADSLGAEYIVYGDVGSLGSATVVNVNLFDAAAGKAAARQSVEVPSIDLMPAALRPVANQLLQPLGGIPLAANADDGSPLLMIGGATLGVAGVLAVGLGAASIYAESVVSEPKNNVEAKEDAIGWGRLTLVGAAASGVVALVGAGILVAGVME